MLDNLAEYDRREIAFTTKGFSLIMHKAFDRPGGDCRTPMLETLKRRIMEADHDDLFSELIFERIPHVFDGDVDVCRAWTGRLAKMLNVDSSEVKLVGGAAVGFSLNPHKNFAAFSPDSDIDVAIVSDHYFSEAWHYLRSLDLTLAPITDSQRAAIGEHRRRFIYWGTIAADRILSVLPFAPVWMAARESIHSTRSLSTLVEMWTSGFPTKVCLAQKTFRPTWIPSPRQLLIWEAAVIEKQY